MCIRFSLFIFSVAMELGVASDPGGIVYHVLYLEFVRPHFKIDFFIHSGC